MRRNPMLDPRGRPPGIDRIVPGLCVGEYPRPEDVPGLRGLHGIDAVLSLQDDDDLAIKSILLGDLETEYARHGIEFRRVPIADNMPEAVAFRIDEAVSTLQDLVARHETVLLHCNAGYNRAPTVAIAWLHVHRDFELLAACDHVKSRRACVPFMTVLRRRFR